MDLRIPIIGLAILMTVDFGNGKPSFEYIVNNQLVLPYFYRNISLEIDTGENLVHYLAKAVEENSSNFTGFTTIYFKSLGYFIDSINGLKGECNMYWQFRNSDGAQNIGASTYIPSNQDTYIMWNYTTY